MSLEPVVRLEGVVKRYGEQVALDDVSLEVPPGVVFRAAGRKWCRQDDRDPHPVRTDAARRGRASVLGLDSQRDAIAIRQSVGYVAERPALDEWMTVEEIGWFAAGFHAVGFLENYQRHAADFGLQLSKKLNQLIQRDAFQGGPLAGPGPRPASADSG